MNQSEITGPTDCRDEAELACKRARRRRRPSTSACEMGRANAVLEGRLRAARAAAAANRRLAERYRALAYLDSLTGLLNRRGLEHSIDAMLARAFDAHRPAHVLMFDIDRFKQINDRYGHAAGDLALAAASCVAATTVERLGWLGRLGGDEFAAVVPAAWPHEADRLALAIVRQLETLVVPADGNYARLGASVGLAQAAPDDTTASLLARADEALYAAKRSGRRCAFRAAWGLLLPIRMENSDTLDHCMAAKETPT